MQKEILNGEVMQELVDGFADEGWKYNKGILSLKSDDGTKEFAYYDYSNVSKEIEIKEVALRMDDNRYRLLEYPSKESISYILVMPPLRGESLSQEEGNSEVFYGPDGMINRATCPGGLPRQIDMDKTAELFLRQVAEKDFSTPVLVKAA